MQVGGILEIISDLVTDVFITLKQRKNRFQNILLWRSKECMIKSENMISMRMCFEHSQR